MDHLIRGFLERYERANSASNFLEIGNLYADTFLFGGPEGVRAVKKEDFLRVVPKMKARFASMGLSETRLHSVEASAIDSRYLLAKAGWRMTVQDPTGHRRSVDTFATYVLEQHGDAISIVFQIDHQDLATILKDLQNTPQSSTTG